MVILADQALEIVALGKSSAGGAGVAAAGVLDYDPTGFADADYGAIK